MSDVLKLINGNDKKKINHKDLVDKRIAISFHYADRSQVNRILEFLENNNISIDDDTWGQAYNKYGNKLCIRLQTRKDSNKIVQILYATKSFYFDLGYQFYDISNIELV